MNKVLEKVRNGSPSFGAWIQIGHPAIAEMLSHFGFDWTCVDLEHGIINIETMTSLFRTIENGGSVPFVRLPSQDPCWVHRVIDAGAKGIIVPMVNASIEAYSVISNSKYPIKYNDGRRGFGFSRSNLYGVKFESYIQEANEEIMVVIQIEHYDAILNIKPILEVAGIDATFIGPYDLSGSMGISGDLTDQRYIKALEEYHDASSLYRVPTGCHIVYPNKQNILESIEQGYKFIALGLDVTFFAKAVNDCISDLKEILK